MPEINPASDFSWRLLNSLVDQGLSDIIVAPGSRSQALALAAAELAEAGRIRLHVRIDERSAAFLALGIGVESGRPAAVITTSGTAVINLLPAVTEAHHSGVPLIVLTADRPEELHGIGTSQTTRQTGFFGHLLRAEYSAPVPEQQHPEFEPGLLASRAFSAATAALSPGPVQVNLAFTEPLSGAHGEWSSQSGIQVAGSAITAAAAEQELSTLVLEPDEATLVIAGNGAGEAAELAARELGAPLIAEVSSGARFGPNLIVSYRKLLRLEEFASQVKRVAVFGLPTLSREVPELLARAGVQQFNIRGRHAENYDPARRKPETAHQLQVSKPVEHDTEWLRVWVAASKHLLEETAQDAQAPDLELYATPGFKARAEFIAKELAELKKPVTRQSLAQSVWSATWPHDRLFVAASLLIRSMDSVVGGKKITVHSNRGVAGIDGTIASGIGAALAQQRDSERGVMRIVLGDLAAVHDAGSLFFSPGEERPRVQVIIANDGGGAIFDRLEVAQSAAPDAFDRVMFTPQQLDFSSLAAAYGWQYYRIEEQGKLDQLLSQAVTEPMLIEVVIPR